MSRLSEWPRDFDIHEVLWAAHCACVEVAFREQNPCGADFSEAVAAAIKAGYVKRGGIIGARKGSDSQPT